MLFRSVSQSRYTHLTIDTIITFLNQLVHIHLNQQEQEEEEEEKDQEKKRESKTKSQKKRARKKKAKQEKLTINEFSITIHKPSNSEQESILNDAFVSEITEDYIEAENLYNQAIKKSDIDINKLCSGIWNCNLRTNNSNKAFKFITQNQDKSFVACSILAECYAKGFPQQKIKINRKKAIELYKKAFGLLKGKSSFSYEYFYNIGIIYRNEYEETKNNEDLNNAIKSCEIASKEISEAHYPLGNLYYSRYDNKKNQEDLKKAIFKLVS